MGKIRIKSLGDEEKEKKQKERDTARREGRKVAKLKGKGGGRIVEMEGAPIVEPVIDDKPENTETQKGEKTQKKDSVSQKHPTSLRSHSRNYLHIRGLVDKTKTYQLNQALELVKKTNLTKFDATVELHINTLEKGLKTSVKLPYPTGKQIIVAIVDDKLLQDIEAGKINFDVLISHPSFMPKLAKLAKTLGPKGLMPNPKNGTISTNPNDALNNFTQNLQLKTESEFPIIHTIIGKLSMGEEKLTKNFASVIKTIGETKIKSVFLKSTMSPSVRVQFS